MKHVIIQIKVLQVWTFAIFLLWNMDCAWPETSEDTAQLLWSDDLLLSLDFSWLLGKHRASWKPICYSLYWNAVKEGTQERFSTGCKFWKGKDMSSISSHWFNFLIEDLFINFLKMGFWPFQILQTFWKLTDVIRLSITDSKSENSVRHIPKLIYSRGLTFMQMLSVARNRKSDLKWH